MASIEPELWVDRASDAVAFYEAAFGATALHRVGEGDDIVCQLAVGDARFWVAAANPETGRFNPRTLGGATSRTLLVVDDPETFMDRAVDAGAAEKSPVGTEHGWRIGRIIDPFGHEWEIGRPIGAWPPDPRSMASTPLSSPPEPKLARAGGNQFDSLTLTHFARAGGDLTTPTNVVNFIYFPTEAAAHGAAAALERDGYRVNVQHAVLGTKWFTQANIVMVLSLENVASQRARFESVAATHGGEYSGWEAVVTK